MQEDVRLLLKEQKAVGFKDTTIQDVGWVQKRHDWQGLAGVVMVESRREFKDKIEQETRFYIASPTLSAPMIRDHWAVENSLYWVMDMTLRDNECRMRIENAPANFVTIKNMATNLIRRAPGKDSQRLKRMTAAWDDESLASLVAARAFTPFPCGHISPCSSN